MAEKFNRAITISVREVKGAEVGDVFLDEFTFLGQENENRLPYEISGSISKSITSNADQCTITIQNPLVLETLYQERDLFLTELSEKDYVVTVSAGYDNDVQIIHSGDLIDISVTGGTSITDQAIILKSSSGYRALSRAKIKERFIPGQIFKDIVDVCFGILEDEYGIILAAYDDPDLKLEKELIKPRTEDRAISECLNDICREFDFTWGIDARQTAVDVQRGYFVDKRSVFDVMGIYGAIVEETISYQTGLISLPSFSRTKFEFNHKIDKVLNVGQALEVDWQEQINTATLFPGRINSINASFSNKTGAFEYQIECSFLDDDGLAKLDFRKTNVGAERLS